MEPTLDRRRLLATAATTAVAGSLSVVPGSARLLAAGAPSGERPAISASYPTQDPEVVREVVGVSHGNLPRLRELVEGRPALAKAAWDWGFGDWESALGAASHVGNREIALFLIEHGARPNLFSAAMLGQLDVVRAFVEAQPGIQATAGPHGIPLLAHARAGGSESASVVEYLERVGGADRGPSLPLDEGGRAAYLGEYSWGTGESDRFRVFEGGRGGLMVERPGRSPRGLVVVGEGEFHPAGAPRVRLRFHREGDRVTALTVHDGELVVTARRPPGG